MGSIQNRTLAAPRPTFDRAASRLLPVGLTVMRSDFAGLLDATQRADATRDFRIALSDLASSLVEEPSSLSARKAHGMITYAIVFGRDVLEDCCRAFASSVADNDGTFDSARDELLREIERSSGYCHQ